MGETKSFELAGVSAEWLDSNKSRSYPFADTCADDSNRIPSSVFTDALFIASVGSASEALSETQNLDCFVSKIVLGQTSFQVYMTFGKHTDVFCCDIPYTTKDRTQINVSVEFSNGDNVSGFFIVGDVSAIKTIHSAVLEPGMSGGKLFEGCIRNIFSSGITGIYVDDVKYTGTIKLVAGDGIKMTVTTEDDITTINLGLDIDLGTSDINTDDALIDALVGDSRLGTVKTINGVPPVDGNINLLYRQTSNNSNNQNPGPTENTETAENTENTENTEIVSYRAFAGSNHAIILDAILSGGVSLDNMSDTLDSTASDLSELNERCSRLEGSVSALDDVLSTISVALATTR